MLLWMDTYTLKLLFLKKSRFYDYYKLYIFHLELD